MDERRNRQGRWEKTVRTFPITLGEFSLASPKLDFIVCRDHFSRIPSDRIDRPPLEEMNAFGVDAAMIEPCPISGPIPKISLVNGVMRYAPDQYRHFMVVIRGSLEEYLASMKGKTRATLLRKVRNYEKRFGKDSFREYRSDRVSEFIALARPLSAKTWQERFLGKGLPQKEDFQRYLEDLPGREALRGYFLFAGDTPVAYVLGPVLEGQIFLFDHTGYDPEFNNWSPGLVLQYKIVEHFFREREITAYDLCDGESQMKRTLANDYQLSAITYFFRLKPKNIALVACHHVLKSTTRAVGRVLDRIQMKNRIKKFFRSRRG